MSRSRLGADASELIDLRAVEAPDGIAWTDGARSVDHAEMRARVIGCAAALRWLGVGPGDVVTLLMANRLEFVVALHGALRIGAVVQPLDAASGSAEIGLALSDVDSRSIVTDAAGLEACRPVVEPTDRRLLVVGLGAGGEVPGFDAVLEAALEATPDEVDGASPPGQVGFAPDAPALVLYTSGSTGAPKRIIFARQDLLTDARLLAEAAAIGADEPIVCVAPFSHSYGLDSAVFLALVTGAPLCSLAPDRRPFAARADEAAALVAAVGGRVLVSVPVQLEVLSVAPAGALGGLRLVFSTGSALPSRVYHRFAERFGLSIRSLYGSTELGTITGDLGAVVDPATVGSPLPGVDVRVVGPAGAPCPPGQVGEVEVRSAVPIRPYADGTRLAGSDGWARSGDRGRLDDDGRLILDGRSARFVDLAGFKVDPREVELLLSGAAGVEQVAVVGVVSPAGPSLQAAYCGSAEPGALRAYCAAHLAPYKVPSRFVRIDALPRGAAGKIQRPVLAGLLAERPERVSGAGPLDPATVLERILDTAAQRLGARPDPDVPLHDAGLGSADLVALAGKLSDTLDRLVPVTALFDHPSPAELVAWLTGASEARAEPAGAAASGDTIAIVALACRFPGGVKTPSDLWRLLDDGVDAIGPFPEDRGWPLGALFDTDPSVPGRSYVDCGGFLDAPGDFDPALFGLSPREAIATDPQQRILLELAWEAFERGGLDPRGVRDRAIGTYVGLWPNLWLRRMPPAARAAEGYPLLGASGSVAAGRIAYTFGLTGPTLTVDTACSSSLVALHLACRALRQGDCTLALAGGATVFAEPDDFIWFSRLQALAPDGRSKAFAAQADGAGWAEGAGLVLLERLDDALQNGHPVLAIVRGSAVNQDGRSQGLTAPSGRAQRAVIRAALAAGGTPAETVDVIEAHGTGTSLGDPIEAGALLATYGRDRSGPPALLGSIKSNLGHTQAAAGIAGLFKIVLSLIHERIPASLHIDAPTPAVQWSSGGIQLATAPSPWPRGERPRRGAVSSFGMSGTNAHVVIEEAPATEPRADVHPALPDAPLLVSGLDPQALRAQASRWARWWRARPGVDSAQVKRAAARRPRLPARAAIAGLDSGGLIEALDALAAGATHPAIAVGVRRADARPVFVFAGHGSQWTGMGRALADESPVFSDVIDRCERALDGIVDWSLRAILCGRGPGEPPIDRVDVAQPCIFAMGLALAETWRGLGVEPAAVLGHSVGEIAAAVFAGALSLEDGARLVALRGQFIANAADAGGMLSVDGDDETLASLVDGYGGRVSIAVVNAVGSAVLSGDADALGQIEAACVRQGLFHRRVRIGFAAHSHHMDAIVDDFVGCISVEPRDGTVPFYSSVTGDRVEGSALGPDYWRRNLRDVVRFDRAMAALRAGGRDVVIEIGGHPVLTPAMSDALGNDAVIVPSMRRGDPGSARLLASAGRLYVRGVAVDWDGVMGSGPAAPLPTYAFQRARYWPDPVARSGGAGWPRTPAPGHPLLASITTLAGEQTTLVTGALSAETHGWLAGHRTTLVTGALSAETHGWLAGHRILGATLVSGTTLLDLALAAGRAVGHPVVEELMLRAPVALPARGGLAVQMRVEPGAGDGLRPLAIHIADAADDEADWQLAATATLSASATAAADAMETFGRLTMGLGASEDFIEMAEGLLSPEAAEEFMAGRRQSVARWSQPGAHRSALEDIDRLDPLTPEGIGARAARVCVLADWLRRGGPVSADTVRKAAREVRGALKTLPDDVHGHILSIIASIFAPRDHTDDPIRDFALGADLYRQAIAAVGEDSPSGVECLGNMALYRSDGDVAEHLAEARRLFERCMDVARRIGAVESMNHAQENLAELDDYVGVFDSNTRAERSIEVLRRRVRQTAGQESLASQARLAWALTKSTFRRSDEYAIPRLEEAEALFRGCVEAGYRAPGHLDLNHTVCRAVSANRRGGRPDAVRIWRDYLSTIDRDTHPHRWATAAHNLAEYLFPHDHREWTRPLLDEAFGLYSEALGHRSPAAHPRHAWETSFAFGNKLITVAEYRPDLIDAPPGVIVSMGLAQLAVALEVGRSLGGGYEMLMAARRMAHGASIAPHPIALESVGKRILDALDAGTTALLVDEGSGWIESEIAWVMLFGGSNHDDFRRPPGPRAGIEWLDPHVEEIVRPWWPRFYAAMHRRRLAARARPVNVPWSTWHLWLDAVERRDAIELQRRLDDVRSADPGFLMDDADWSATETWLAERPASAVVAMSGARDRLLALVVDHHGGNTRFRVAVLHTPDADPRDATGPKGLEWAQAQTARLRALMSASGILPSHVLWCPGGPLREMSPQALWPQQAVAVASSPVLLARPLRIRPRRTLLVAADPAETFDDEFRIAAGDLRDVLGPDTRVLISQGRRHGEALVPGAEPTPASPTEALRWIGEYDLIVLLAHGRVDDVDEAVIQLQSDDGTAAELRVTDIARNDGLRGASVMLLSCETGQIGERHHRPGGLAGAFLAAGASEVMAPLTSVGFRPATRLAEKVAQIYRGGGVRLSEALAAARVEAPDVGDGEDAFVVWTA